MLEIIKKWLQLNFSDPEAIAIVVSLVIIIAVFMLIGSVLVPIIASIIIAYMLNGFVGRLERWKFPHLLAVILAFLLFMGAVLIFFMWLFPLLFQQLGSLFNEIPHILNRGQTFLMDLQKHHPEYFSAEQLRHFLTEFSQYLTRFGKFILSVSFASISNIITIVVYLILVPLLVFFFLKDSKQISKWLGGFLPEKHQTIIRIWYEVDRKIGDYIRGKIIEILMVGFISIISFALMGLHYAALLAVGVGLSVLIPYVGAILVTIPVVIIAAVQWGWSAHLAYLLLIYAIILTLDANIIVPILFSEKMHLHPVIIILAVLVFGGLLGFWGVFFAIPLATLVDALLKNWPRKIEEG